MPYLSHVIYWITIPIIVITAINLYKRPRPKDHKKRCFLGLASFVLAISHPHLWLIASLIIGVPFGNMWGSMGSSEILSVLYCLTSITLSIISMIRISKNSNLLCGIPFAFSGLILSLVIIGSWIYLFFRIFSY